MVFHPSKRYVLRINRSRQQTTYNYTMSGHTLQSVDQHPYLGVIITKTLNWKAQVSDVKNKANKTLGFIKRNLHPRSNKGSSLHLPGKTNCGICQHSLGSVSAISDPVARKRTETSCPLRNKNIWIRTRLCNKGPQLSPVSVTLTQKKSRKTNSTTKGIAQRGSGQHPFVH